MSFEAHVDGTNVTIWPRERRVFIPGPVSAMIFAANGPVMTMVTGICGDDAVACASIGKRLGGFAFCADGDVEQWRRDLGMT